MARRLAVLATILASALPAASQAPTKAQALLREKKDASGRVTVEYRFDPAGGEYVTPAAQAARRGKEAAEAWGRFDKGEKPVAVVARSPYGGGETASSYWPDGIRAELLRGLAEPLTKAGLKVVFPELPPEPGQEPAPAAEPPAPAPEAKPWPKLGFGEDYEFVLVIGLHHEPIPYQGARRSEDGKPVYSRGSRFSAWAILFHAPTGTGFWGTTAVARVGHQGVADPLNLAAETVLGYLDFSELGSDSIPGQIEKLGTLPDLSEADLAALLAQTQRADAIEAMLKFGVSKPAYRTKPLVLRYFNEKGTAQDYRITPEQAKAARCVYAAQPVTMRVLLMEQLRGMRSVQACSVTALVPLEEDIEYGKLGQTYAGQTPPLGPDDEIILISELASDDARGIFKANSVAAVRNLGKCRTHLEEAMAVARYYAERPTPPPPRGRTPRQDPLKEGGRQALSELQQTKAEQQKKRAAKGQE